MGPASVLAFIVPKLVIQAENAVSDCLFFILSTYPEAANSLISYLGPTGLVLPAQLEFTTQLMWKYGAGRPDMLGMSDERAVLVVESKFDAPLTKNQPVAYVEYLPQDDGGLLLFLAPAARLEELWDALTKRCIAARLPLGPRADVRDGLLAAKLRGTHCLSVASWESLMRKLLEDLSSGNNPKAHADVAQLSALCERLLSGELAPFPVLADPGRDKRDSQLRTMVDQVATRLIKAGHAVTKGYRATPGPGYYKRYMTLSGHVNWCVEFNTEVPGHGSASHSFGSPRTASGSRWKPVPYWMPNSRTPSAISERRSLFHS